MIIGETTICYIKFSSETLQLCNIFGIRKPMNVQRFFSSFLIFYYLINALSMYIDRDQSIVKGKINSSIKWKAKNYLGLCIPNTYTENYLSSHWNISSDHGLVHKYYIYSIFLEMWTLKNGYNKWSWIKVGLMHHLFSFTLKLELEWNP